MTPQFTTPCYVRVDDKNKRREVCEKLEPVGYKIKVDCTEDINQIIVASKLGILHDASKIESTDFVDCGTNIDLFLALAGMRSDTDKEQWYHLKDDTIVNTDIHIQPAYKIMFFSTDGDAPNYYLKATAQEIVNHYKTQEK